VIGSYPIPGWLSDARSDPHALHDALHVVLRTQELCGIDVLSDGELARFDPTHPETNGMIEYFVSKFSGISTQLTRSEREDFEGRKDLGFRAKPAGVVRKRLGEGTLDLAGDWSIVQQLATRPVKFTVTSPFMLAKTLHDTAYGDFAELTLDIARVLSDQVRLIDSDVIQIDEANLPGDPEGAGLAAEAINQILANVKSEKGVHLCFGNYGGQTVQQGLWDSLLPFFNSLECDHLLLEFARRGYDELEAFQDLKPNITLGIGVIDIKDNEVESEDTVARRIEGAVQTLGHERIRWVHPDCGFWMLPRSVADAKMRNLVKGRDKFLSAGS
jgi:5-methyltetrahydropteroyltriglutamate--homocysteine methyltransferase